MNSCFLSWFCVELASLLVVVCSFSYAVCMHRWVFNSMKFYKPDRCLDLKFYKPQVEASLSHCEVIACPQPSLETSSFFLCGSFFLHGSRDLPFGWINILFSDWIWNLKREGPSIPCISTLLSRMCFYNNNNKAFKSQISRGRLKLKPSRSNQVQARE